MMRRRTWPFWPAIAVLLVGLVATGVLTAISAGLNSRNEKRLLALRAHDVGTVLTAALPSLQTPLASAAALADATGGDTAKFRSFIAPYVGPGKSFASASLWRVSDPGAGPVAVVGIAPALASRAQQVPAFFRHAAVSSGLSVIGMLQGASPRLGYAFTGTARGPFAAYGESVLPSGRYIPAQSNPAFNDIDFALFLGASTNPADLLVASVRQLPLSGQRSTVKVPFGDTYFTVTVTARRTLGGSLPQRLPWAIAIGGALLSIGAALLTMRLIARRRDAEGLAARLEEVAEENRRLYAEQRGIAQTLQRALLPQTLPQLPGLQASGRYEAGVEGVEIGGDWYDLIALDARRLLLVVGDVSGRGIPAATTMASLRFSIRAYAKLGDAPDTLLARVSELLSVEQDRQLATVLCASVDIRSRTVSIASAGHLPPLLITPAGSEFVEGEVGLPLGVDRRASYAATTIWAPPGATLLAFTDGLVERRGESIDEGLERLRSRASPDGATLDELLARVMTDVRDDGGDDDTAIVGVRWVS